MEKNMKTVGIIGGLGPETTTHFYMRIISECSKKGMRPSLLVDNVALPLDIEKEVIIEARNEEQILPFLLNSIKRLEKAGADFIVIPCNTVHLFIDEIRQAVNIPVLSIIEETVEFLLQQKTKEIGLLATTATVKNKLFDRKLQEKGIKAITLNKLDQKELSRIIHRLVKGDKREEDKNRFSNMITNLQTSSILLACTDLQLLKVKKRGIQIFDTLEILVHSTVLKIVDSFS